MFFSSFIFLLPHHFVLEFFSSFFLFSHMYLHTVYQGCPNFGLSMVWKRHAQEKLDSMNSEVGLDSHPILRHVLHIFHIPLHMLLTCRKRTSVADVSFGVDGESGLGCFLCHLHCSKPSVEMKILQWKTTSLLLGRGSFFIGSDGREKTTPFEGRGSMFFLWFSERDLFFSSHANTPPHRCFL